MNEIYISYAWKDNQSELGKKREEMVDRICNSLLENNYKLIRDKNELTIGNSIRKFMQEIGKGNYVIVVVSNKYLWSEYCMYEAIEIMNNSGNGQRIFPIVLKDANIYSNEGRLSYINYWKEQSEEIQLMMEATNDLRVDFAMNNVVEKINEIANKMDDFIYFISDKLSINPEENFEGFMDAVTSSIKKDNDALKSKRNILVAGTGTYHLPNALHWCSQSLGAKIAAENYNLISGGWHGVDYIVSEAYSMVIINNNLKLSDKLTQIVPYGKQAEFKGGTIEYVEEGAKEWLSSLKKADVVVLIGGEGGTYETYKYAQQENIPVIPIVCTDGDAKAVYDDMIMNGSQKNHGNISTDKFKSLNQYINNKETAEQVCDDVMEMIDEIIFSKEVLK